MVNRSNRGFTFPTLDLRQETSPEVYSPGRGAEISPAARMLGAAAEGFGQSLEQLAQREAVGRGRAQAAADARDGTIHAVDETTVFGDAYGRVARDVLSTQRQMALSEEMGKAFIAHPDDPAELDTAFAAIRQGMGRTQFEDLDVRLDGVFATMAADYRVRATAEARKKVIGQGVANFQTSFTNGQSLLDQAASGAAMDEGGAQRVTQAFTLFIDDLAKYGPKGAFTAAGVEFAADETRLGVLSPEVLTQQALAAQGQARSVWILAASEKIGDAEGRRGFAASVRDRWRAGDPAFAGLDGVAIERVTNAIEADANRLDVDARSARAMAGQDARDALEAMSWGAEVDADRLVADARASGDAGLIAQAELFAGADPNALLRPDAAQLRGLVPDADAWFSGGAGGGGTRGLRNHNPGNVKALDRGRMWPGQVGVDAQGFAVFGSRGDGIAAARSNLKSYGARGIDTTREIINRWAPPSENDTGAYVAAVARRLGVPPDQKLDLGDEQTMTVLLDAIFQHENGPAWRTSGGAGGPPDAFLADPIDYARGTTTRRPMGSVSALALDGVFGAAPDVGAWGAALRQRRGLARTLADGSGRGPRLLTNGERSYYKDILDQPDKALTLVGGVRGALGEEGARDFLREIGGAPEVNANLVHMADLAIAGSSFARRAARGMTLKAGGGELDKISQVALDRAFAEVEPALRTVAGSRVPARNVAALAMLADRAEGIDREADYYVKSALGAVSEGGRTYGGPVNINGVQTIAPSWLATDRMDEALEAMAKSWADLGRGPVWSSGEAMSAREVAGLRPVLTPDGRYRLVLPKTGKAVTGRDGRTFEVDIDAGRAFLRRVLGPDAVRSGQ